MTLIPPGPGGRTATETADCSTADAEVDAYLNGAAPDGRGVPDTPAAPPEAPRLWRATDLDPARRVEWLARRRIPRGAVTYMLGPEGIGKSMFMVWLTAYVTTGKPFPEFGIPPRDPGIVVLVLTEDDWSTTVRPRLELAGADLEHVRVLCTEQDGSGSPTFPAHMDLLEQTEEPIALVIVDAWADTLPSSMNVKDPQQARRALHPWKEMATRTGAAVLLSGHTNREGTGNVRNAYGLTGELRKKARLTLLAQPDADNEGHMLIGPEKSNLTGPVPASRFRLESVQVFPPTDDSDGTVPRMVWAGDAEQSAREYFAEAADDEGRADRTEAEAWLEDFLTEQGRVKRAEVIAAATKARVASESTIKRAAKKLRVKSEPFGFPRETYWQMPDAS